MARFAIALACLLAVSTASGSRDLLAAPAPAPSPAAPIADSDVLNFALNLECLEAEFYSWAAYGKGLSAADRGNGPASTGGQKAQLTPTTQGVAEAIANDEINHVRFLRAALGAAAVPCPAINIGSAFAVAADVALNATLEPTFSPYSNDVTFLHGAFIFEDVGVTAYLGAAPLLAHNPTLLAAGAGIAVVEAYHGGAIRDALAAIAEETVSPYGVPVASIIQAISNLRDAVDGPTDLDQGLLSANGTVPIIAPANANSIAFSRTPAEVLAIVYLGDATMPGGFFPAGLNGLIK